MDPRRYWLAITRVDIHLSCAIVARISTDMLRQRNYHTLTRPSEGHIDIVRNIS